MKSAGNDIVALNAASIERAANPAFYNKFITASEVELHQQTGLNVLPFAHYNWLLWSVKEAAFKYLKRVETQLLFSPIKMIISDMHTLAGPVYPNLTIEEGLDGKQQFFTGQVCFENKRLFFRTVIADLYIASVVDDDVTFKNVYWGIGRVEDENSAAQSKAVRKSILAKLVAVLNTGGLSIDKDSDAIPQLKKNGSPLAVPLSLAHHHHFIAYSFALNV